MIRKSKHPTSSALMGVAFFQGLIGLGGWAIYSPTHPFGIYQWIATFSGILFFILSIIARFARLPAALVGCIFYTGLLGYQALIGIQALLEGLLLIKLPVIILLAYALITAFRETPKPPVVTSDSALENEQ